MLNLTFFNTFWRHPGMHAGACPCTPKVSKWCKIPLKVYPRSKQEPWLNFKHLQRSLILCATSFKNLVCQGLATALWSVQIKNIKLHIVTDIKVTFNSMLGFRISLFGWGDGYFIILKKILPFMVAISFIITYSYCHALGLQTPLIWPQFCHV